MLTFQQVDEQVVWFVFTDENKVENKFSLDFRYYEAYSGTKAMKSGPYVFKTPNKESKSYEHTIKRISVHKVGVF